MARSRSLLWKTMAILLLVVMISRVNSADEELAEDELADIFDESDDDDSSLDTSLAVVVRKGRRCNPIVNNICPGIPAKNGRQFLQCCKNRCRNVLTDRNHCGVCGTKCTFLHLCCNRKCTPAAFDVNNCGKCGRKCPPGEKCLFGICGYA